MEQALADGTIEVWLEGKKLRGGFVLVHSRLRGVEKNWLLIKMKDERAHRRRNLLQTAPESVLSGRTVAELAASGRS